MRTKGHKCYNIKCGACVGKTLCGLSGDEALTCEDRMVNQKTNADRIRAMSDEELCDFLYSYKYCDMCEEGCGECHYHGDCERRLADWLQQPAKEDA